MLNRRNEQEIEDTLIYIIFVVIAAVTVGAIWLIVTITSKAFERHGEDQVFQAGIFIGIFIAAVSVFMIPISSSVAVPMLVMGTGVLLLTILCADLLPADDGAEVLDFEDISLFDTLEDWWDGIY